MDTNARIDIPKLRAMLQDRLERKQAVYAVVAIVEHHTTAQIATKCVQTSTPPDNTTMRARSSCSANPFPNAYTYEAKSAEPDLN